MGAEHGARLCRDGPDQTVRKPGGFGVPGDSLAIREHGDHLTTS